MSEWQPIETAPKDEHVQILTFKARTNNILWAGPWYQTSFWSPKWGMFVGWPRDEKPTHWMPLPEPPKWITSFGSLNTRGWNTARCDSTTAAWSGGSSASIRFMARRSGNECM
jgi:uncharacterized protein DUF551